MIGAVAAIIKHKFQILCLYAKVNTMRLRLDLIVTTGLAMGAQKDNKKNVIYEAAAVHPQSVLNPGKCGHGAAPRERTILVHDSVK